MVRKVSTTDTEAKKRSKGRPKKSVTTESSAGKRRASKKDNDGEEPQIKKQKIEKILNFFKSAPSGVALALGQGEFGQLGLGEDIISRKKPALVSRELAGKKLKKIAAGGMHTVCLTDDHKVYTFGCNDEGSLGRAISDDSEEFEPGVVSGAIEGVKIIDISAGDSHTAALSENGEVYIWGCFRDNHGKLGLVREWEGSKVPIHLATIKQAVTRIASGCDHVAILTDEGKVYTIGCGEQGQLGRISRYFLTRGGRRSADSPTRRINSRRPKLSEELCLQAKTLSVPKVKGKSGKPVISDIYCGSYCTYMVSTAGDVFACGLNNYNQLGIPDEEGKYGVTHIPVLSDQKWSMISGGQHHTLLLDDRGDVFSIGRGDYGRLGLGEDVTISNEPKKVEGLENIVHISAGPCVSFAVDKHGKAYGWGMGTNLQLTTGEEDDEWTPVELSGKNLEERSVITVEGGGQHTVLLACDKSEVANGGDAS